MPACLSIFLSVSFSVAVRTRNLSPHLVLARIFTSLQEVDDALGTGAIYYRIANGCLTSRRCSAGRVRDRGRSEWGSAASNSAVLQEDEGLPDQEEGTLVICGPPPLCVHVLYVYDEIIISPLIALRSEHHYCRLCHPAAMACIISQFIIIISGHSHQVAF